MVPATTPLTRISTPEFIKKVRETATKLGIDQVGKIRLAGAFSILILIAAEMVGAKAGLGYLINYAQYNFAVPDMYAGIITISAIGLVVNQLLVALERRFSTWRTQ